MNKDRSSRTNAVRERTYQALKKQFKASSIAVDGAVHQIESMEFILLGVSRSSSLYGLITPYLLNSQKKTQMIILSA